MIQNELDSISGKAIIDVITGDQWYRPVKNRIRDYSDLSKRVLFMNHMNGGG